MQTQTIELIYDKHCPNVGLARTRLLKALSGMKLLPKWKEWESNDPDAPTYAKEYGSPTILINHQDVTENDPGNGDSCRIYNDADGKIEGAPSIQAIAAALSPLTPANKKPPASSRFSWRKLIPMFPSIGVALAPKLVCPMCWPAYTALLGAFGVSFTNYTPYLLPVMLGLLAIAVGILAFRAKNRWGYGPFWLGVVSAALLLLGKFTWDMTTPVYVGTALLVAASVWNAWPRRKFKGAACSACIPATPDNK